MVSSRAESASARPSTLDSAWMGERHLHRARSWPGLACPQRGRWIVADVLSRADPSGHESWRVRLVVEASPSNRHRARPLAKSPWSQLRRTWLSWAPMPLTAAGAAAHGRRETSFRRCAPDQSGSARRSADLARRPRGRPGRDVWITRDQVTAVRRLARYRPRSSGGREPQRSLGLRVALTGRGRWPRTRAVLRRRGQNRLEVASPSSSCPLEVSDPVPGTARTRAKASQECGTSGRSPMERMGRVTNVGTPRSADSR